MAPEPEPETYLVRGRRVHLLDELGRTLEVTGRDREIVLVEATVARVLRELELERATPPPAGR